VRRLRRYLIVVPRPLLAALLGVRRRYLVTARLFTEQNTLARC
jgi:hypothetical protein